MKRGGDDDVGMQGLIHGAGERGIFESRAVFGGNARGDFDLHGQLSDAAGGHGDHFLSNVGGSTLYVHIVSLGVDAHQGDHAGTERRADEVGWGERFAASLVVFGRIRADDILGRPMSRAAMKVAFVNNVHINHLHSPFLVQFIVPATGEGIHDEDIGNQ